MAHSSVLASGCMLLGLLGILASGDSTIASDSPDALSSGLRAARECRYADAERELKKALDASDRRKIEDGSYAQALDQLARVLYSQARAPEADSKARRALTIREKLHGESDPRVAETLVILSKIESSQRKDSDAFAHAKRALAIVERTCGVEHPEAANALSALAEVHLLRKEFNEADSLLRRALTILEKSKDHGSGVAVILDTMSEIAMERDNPQEAESLLRRALAIQERALRPDHPDIAMVLADLADALEAANRIADAEPLARRALTIREKELEADHPLVAESLYSLAYFLCARADYAQAEPRLKRALDIVENQRPGVRQIPLDRQQLLIGILQCYAYLLTETGRPEEAAKMAARADLVREEKSSSVLPQSNDSLVASMMRTFRASLFHADARQANGGE